jgi:predicted permease
VGIQVAFAFCLVMAGASFLFTLRNLLAVNTGFDARGVTVVSLSGKAQTDAASLALMHQLAERLSASAGIEGTALAPWPVFTGAGWDARVMLPGKGPSERQETFYNISPGFFATLRIPVVDGRSFDRQDDANREPVPTIVNRAFERRYFGRGQALGETFQAPQGHELKAHRVVGVVADATFGDLRKPPEPVVYLPIVGSNDFVVYVRSSMPAGSVARFAGRIAKDLGSDLHVTDLTTLNALVGDTILQEKLLAGLGAVFAVLGLALAAIGLFGLLNYSVLRRTKELGIRGALGAQQSELIGLVFRDLFGMVAGGLSVGLAGSLVLLLGLRSLLFGVRPIDPLVIGVAAGVFLSAAVIAGGIPALRAARVAPMVALRQE